MALLRLIPPKLCAEKTRPRGSRLSYFSDMCLSCVVHTVHTQTRTHLLQHRAAFSFLSDQNSPFSRETLPGGGCEQLLEEDCQVGGMAQSYEMGLHFFLIFSDGPCERGGNTLLSPSFSHAPVPRPQCPFGLELAASLELYILILELLSFWDFSLGL